MEMLKGKPKNYFQKHTKILKVLGIPLKGGNNLIYRIYSLMILSSILACPLLSIPDLLNNEYDDAIRTIVMEGAFVGCIMKVITVYLKRNKIMNVIKKLEEKPFLADLTRGGLHENVLINKFSTINRIQSSIYWVSAIVYWVFINFVAIIRRMSTNDQEKWTSLNFKYVVLNTTYTPHYEIALVHQNISWLVFGICSVTNDLLLGGILCNVLYQFKIIQNYIRAIPLKALKSCPNHTHYTYSTTHELYSLDDIEFEISWTQLRGLVKTVVDYHNEIINLMKEIEDVFSVLFMLIMIITLLTVGSTMYTMSTLLITDSELWQKFVVFFYILTQICFVCYWSDRVKNESYKVGNAAWEICSVIRDSKFQQAMQMIILRTQTPVKLTAGKFTDIEVSIIAWVLRASYSAFMLMRTTHSK